MTITFGGSGRAAAPLPSDAGSVPDMLQTFLHYLGKVWLDEHTVDQDARALAGYDITGPIRDYRRDRREVPVDDGFDLEQSYLVAQLVARTPLTCLRNAAMPAVPASRVARLRSLGPAELVAEVVRRCDRGVTALVYDGNVGHCILLSGADQATGRVVFWDPWPLRSLLCAENNQAGVAAREVPGEFLWTVSTGELARVLFAAFVEG